jgi:hypothetical protein
VFVAYHSCYLCTIVGLPEFKRQWDALGENEVMKKYSLGLDNLQGAVDAVQGLLGMTTCEGSGMFVHISISCC